MDGFGHIKNTITRRAGHYKELAVRKAPKLWLDARYVRRGYMAASSPATTTILLALISASDFKTRQCRRSIRKLMDESGVKNRNTAFRAIRRLQELGVISITSTRGEPHVYEINHSSVWSSINHKTGTRTVPNTPRVSPPIHNIK